MAINNVSTTKMEIVSNKWKLSDEITSQAYTNTLNTAGTFVDKDIDLSFTIPDGVWRVNLYPTVASYNDVTVRSAGVIDDYFSLGITQGESKPYVVEGWLKESSGAWMCINQPKHHYITLADVDTNFTAENIVKGKSMFGITGTGASDTELVFSNILPSGATESDYVDISADAPVLISGSYLYLKEGRLNQNSKISLAKLVPDAANLPSDGAKYIVSDYSAYTKDGTLVAGTINDNRASTISTTTSTDSIYSITENNFVVSKLSIGDSTDVVIGASTGIGATIPIDKIATTAGLTADKIAQGQTILGVAGTADYIKTVSSVPTTKDTSIIYCSADERYYLWSDNPTNLITDEY